MTVKSIEPFSPYSKLLKLSFYNVLIVRKQSQSQEKNHLNQFLFTECLFFTPLDTTEKLVSTHESVYF